MLTFADVFTPSGEAAALDAALTLGSTAGSHELPAGLAATFAAIADIALPFAPPSAADFADDELESAQKAFAELRRRVDVCAASVAREIDHRSRFELGYGGLAQRKGARTAVNLVQNLTGMTATEARSLIAAGAMLPVEGAGDSDTASDTATSAPPAPAWLREVGAALAAGKISVAAADAIRSGLKLPDGVVTEDALAGAAARLLREAPSITVERLGVLARELRNELDLAGVLEREEAMREKRYLQLTKLPDGMTRVSGLLDPESAAIVVPILDAVTSPRRGGPRFVDSDAVARAESIVADERTTGQLTVDTFVQLVRMASLIDDGTVLGHRKPTVRVLVTKRDLDAGEGVAAFEGQTEGVSIQTAQRHVCSGGMLPILFDDDGGQALNRGREKRLFTGPQHDVMAARDGGCRFTDCDRPPSWTEGHHINEYVRDKGLTNVDDGMLLCRHHHMFVHNLGWKIIREGADYFAVPPPGPGSSRQIPLPSKSATHRRLLATA